MEVDSSFLEQLQKIDPGLFVVWNQMFERFQILWRDERTNITRIVMLIEEDDGSFRPCDARALIYCSRVVDWDALHKYPDPFKWYTDYVASKKQAIDKWKADRKDTIKYWNKHHRKEWKAALENAQRGVFGVQKEVKKTISVQVPRWALSEGILIKKEATP